MCGICGCGTEHDHHRDGHRHERGQRGAAPQVRLIDVERRVLEKNDVYAAQNRAWLQANGVLALNLLSSPGSGKTTILTATIRALENRANVAVIEGDQQTDNDARRILAAGARAVQINTGRGCHLDAHGVGHAISELAPRRGDYLFIENVGNLVCPAAFDLGEDARVVVLSVTEGEDKPLKYPDMFHAADLILLNKIDLLPHLAFDLELCLDNARRVKPTVETIRLSATTGQGFDRWLVWLRERMSARQYSACV